MHPFLSYYKSDLKNYIPEYWFLLCMFKALGSDCVLEEDWFSEVVCHTKQHHCLPLISLYKTGGWLIGSRLHWRQLGKSLIQTSYRVEETETLNRCHHFCLKTHKLSAGVPCDPFCSLKIKIMKRPTKYDLRSCLNCLQM